MAPLTAVRVALLALLSSYCVWPSVSQHDFQQGPLLQFYNTMNGPEWFRNDNWGNFDVSVCTWYGVLCQYDAYGYYYLVSLRLNGNNLRGELDESLLEAILFSIDLTSNFISGTIPSSWNGSAYFGTDSIILRENQLSGPFPSALCTFSGVSLLDVSYNNFSGPIPGGCFGGMVELEALHLAGNQFDGELPADMFSAGQIPQVVDVSNNHLTGGLTEALHGAQFIQTLLASHNNFSGPLPLDVVHNVTIALDLSYNSFNSLDCEPYINHVALVQRLLLSHNQLAAPLSSVFDCFLNELTTFVSWLDVSYNQFTWNGSSLTVEVDAFAQLYKIDLSNNLLAGPFEDLLPVLFAYNQLAYVNLSSNQLTGTIPVLAEQLLQLSCSDNSGLLAEFNQFSNPPQVIQPSWIALDTSTIQVQAGRNLSCPTIAPAAGALVQLSIDASYLAYEQCQCLPGYSTDPATKFTQPDTVRCVSCPEHLLCSSQVYQPQHTVEPGYYPWPINVSAYRADSGQLLGASLISCNPSSRCVTSDPSGVGCRAGHDPNSLLCSHCLNDYFMFQGYCHSCGDTPGARWVSPVVIVLSGLLIVLACVWYFTNEETTRWNKEEAPSLQVTRTETRDEPNNQSICAGCAGRLGAVFALVGRVLLDAAVWLVSLSILGVLWVGYHAVYVARAIRRSCDSHICRACAGCCVDEPLEDSGAAPLAEEARTAVGSRHWACFDILIFWYQTSSVLQGLNLGDSTAAADSGSSLATVALVGDLLRFSPYSFECIIPAVDFNTYYWAFLLTPVFTALIVFALYQLYAACRSSDVPVWLYARAALRLLFLLWSIEYMQVAISFFQIVRCDSVEQHQYLIAAPFVTCYTGAHVAQTVFGAVMALAFNCGLLYATHLWMSAYERREQRDGCGVATLKHDVQRRSVLHTASELLVHDQANKLRRASRWWQFTVLGRKLMLIAVVYLIAPTSLAVPMLVLTGLFILLAAQIWYKPYHRTVDNVLEAVLLVQLAMQFLASIVAAQAALEGQLSTYSSFVSLQRALTGIGYAIFAIVVLVHGALYCEPVRLRLTADLERALPGGWRIVAWNLLNSRTMEPSDTKWLTSPPAAALKVNSKPNKHSWTPASATGSAIHTSIGPTSPTMSQSYQRAALTHQGAIEQTYLDSATRDPYQPVDGPDCLYPPASPRLVSQPSDRASMIARLNSLLLNKHLARTSSASSVIEIASMNGGRQEHSGAPSTPVSEYHSGSRHQLSADPYSEF